MSRIVRCYIEGADDEWEAICLDFDIAVQGRSFMEVYENLDAAIRAYLEYVQELPEAERAAFLSRKAPLSLRLQFVWHALCDLFRNDGGPGTPKSRHEFTAPLPSLV